MAGQMKNYKEYIATEYTPINSNELPYFVNMTALHDYAKSKNVAISKLSKEEKEKFLVKNTRVDPIQKSV